MIARFESLELDDTERSVLGHIETHCWNVTNIRGEDGSPGWAFTIGLYENYRHPEVIIFGMSEESRHSILNWIGENVKDGKSFTLNEEHDWVLEGYNCWSREVVKTWYKDLVGWAIWFYGSSDFPVVQYIWPSRTGAYPWEPDAAFFAPQPLLYEENILSARMIHFASDQPLEDNDWPFAEDPHQRVFVSRCVVEDSAPIVRVVHDSDGDWQFIGPVDDPEDDGCILSCFHCVIEREPTIRALAKLLAGWRAFREAPGSDWKFEKAPVELD
jgi:hypothetical protein